MQNLVRVISVFVAVAMMGTALAQDAKKCVALRGNGHYVSAHFGGLARLVEDHGMMQGIAGTSSSTLTAFLYDSILSNPVLENQPELVQRRRVALMLKSVYGLMDELKDRGLALLLGETQIPQHRELLQRLTSTKDDALAASVAYEYQHGVFNIINRRFINFAFSELGGKDFHREQAAEAIRNLSSFRVASPAPLVRPGLFDFESFGALAARLAAIYTQNGRPESERKKFVDWIEQCERRTEGLSWAEIVDNRDYQNIVPCAFDFLSLALDNLRRANYVQESVAHLDPMGRNLEVLIGTGVIEGEVAFKQFRELKRKYAKGEVEADLGIGYEHLRFGYWGSSKDLLARVERNLKTQFAEDEKSKKFLALGGDVNWNTVLTFSPAEPGLSDALTISWPDHLISVGGWSDLHPVQVLQAADCDEIYYITRKGPESDLAVDMVSLFDGGEEYLDELFHLSRQEPDSRFTVDNTEMVSSYGRALRGVTGGVLCTDWNKPEFSGRTVLELGEEGYHAEMIYPASANAQPGNHRTWSVGSADTDASCRPSL